MENNNTENSDGETADELNPGSVNIQANTKANSTQKRKGNPKKSKKWSLIRHWRAAGRKQQIRWVAEGIGGLIAIGYLFNYVWGNLQTKWNFEVEHRPKVILYRPPELLGSLDCNVTDKAVYLHTGAMHIYVRNIRKNGDASGAFVEGPLFKLIPDKKVGVPFFDDLPNITEETCKQILSPKMKAFPVRAEEQVRVDMTQSAYAMSLIKTNSMSITLGGSQPEPQTPSGQSGDKIVIEKDASFQLYAPFCVYYFGDKGERYGSCRSYRLVVGGKDGQADPYSFSCTQTPLTGRFEEVFFGYCEN